MKAYVKSAYSVEQTFYSNGKLLLSGEYVVLDGANAMGLPTVYGQYLKVSPAGKPVITWKSLDNDGLLWYEDSIALHDVLAGNCNGKPETITLTKILHTAHLMNPGVLHQGFDIETTLTFPRHWGLGSSSTLINNIAWWFGIDPYQLLWESFGGSGYDIACARNNTAVLFRKEDGVAIEQPLAFDPPFADKLWFVYLNQKQNSRNAIKNYQSRSASDKSLIADIDALTAQIIAAKELGSFNTAITEHERIMSPVLGLPTVKESLFPDFDGELKSLGAWGGDFILATAAEDPRPYFSGKGYDTVVPYSEMILK